RPALAALVAHVKRGGAKRLAVERFDGEPVTESDVLPLLVEAGFLAGPRLAVRTRRASVAACFGSGRPRCLSTSCASSSAGSSRPVSSQCAEHSRTGA